MTKPRSSHQQRVLGMAGGARPRMSRASTPPRNRSASGPWIRYLYSGRRVEEPGGVADREVLGLLGHLVALRDEVVRPVLPQPGLVQGARPLVERGRPDHRGALPLPALAGMVPRYWTLAQYRLQCPAMARMSAERRRDAIVDAALSVARRKGLAATTVRDVAAEMGSSSGLIHHYFETMDDVVAAAFERVAGRDLDETETLLEAAGDPTCGRARLPQLLRPRRRGLGVPALAGCLGGGGPPARPARGTRAG